MNRKKGILGTILILVIFCVSSYSQDFEVSPVKLSFTAEPGQAQSIPITIINHSSEKSAFTIQLSDFIVNKEGQKLNMQEGSTEHSLVKWMSISPPFIELNPNETKQLIVSIQAPAGDYSTRWANIYITSTIEQTASIADKALQTGVLVQGQILVRAFQSPKSNQNYRVKITNLMENSLPNDSMRTFIATIDNIGEKITTCKVILLASDLTTGKEYLLMETSYESYPDSQMDIKFRFNRNALTTGNYALAAILDYGNKNNLEGTQTLIEVK